MGLPTFADLSSAFSEPFSTLVLNFGELMYQEGKLENFVILGEKFGEKEEVDCNAWWLFGFVPGHDGILQCRMLDTTNEQEREVWNGRFKELIPLLNCHYDYLPSCVRALSAWQMLGHSQSHIIGLIGFYEGAENKKERVVLWKNHRLQKHQAESLMRAVLIERLG